MFVHRQQESTPVACWQAVADRRAGACVPGQPAGCENLARAWMRSPQEGSYRMIAVAQRTGRPRIHRRPPVPRIPIGRGLRVLDTLTLPRLRRWSRLPALPQPQAET